MTSVKKNDLYIYDLSSDVLNTLELMTFDSSVSEVVSSDLPSNAPATSNQALPEKSSSPDSNNCRSCDLNLHLPDEIRGHYKTDIHRFNLKRLVNDLPPVTPAEFEKLTENDDMESISGSDLSDSDSGDDQTDIYREDRDQLTTIFERNLAQLNLSDAVDKDDDDSSALLSHLNTKSPYIYFKSSLLQNDEVFAVYKSIFSAETIDAPLQAIKLWNEQEQGIGKLSALFMIGGGHFAGAIVSHQRLSTKGNARKNDESFQEQAVQFLEHKTFHRYTTRRKQGGSQSAMDNAKGKANSAGSSLRRYNEAALRNDVQQLLASWEPYLQKCENIFIRAKSVSDRNIFLGESSCLKKDDPRIRNFPFTTKRPTASELKKAWCELTYITKTSKPKSIKKTRSPAPTSVSKPVEKATQVKKELTPEEKHTEELISLVKKSKAPLLVSYIRKNKLDANFKLEPKQDYVQTPTMLHYAAQNGLKNMVMILLSNLKCDPTITNDFGKTAWDLARKKEIKYSFQIARHNLGEDFTDWRESHIGEPMSREQVEKLNEMEQQAEADEREEAIKKELQAVREKQRLEKESKRGPGRQFTGQMSNLQQTMNSLTDDQKMRLMREQRARAAEARMRQNTVNK